MDKVQEFEKHFKDKILNWFEKNPRRYYVDFKPKDLLEVSDYIYNNLGARFIIASGLHTVSGMEIIYHYMFDSIGKMVNIRVLIPTGEKYQIESIANIIPGAAWIEREMKDLLGIEFLNHPDPRRFLLPDDAPEDYHPLRKEKLK